MAGAALNFVCNVCGTQNEGIEEFGRETANCRDCKSSVRTRSLLYAMCMELFGTPFVLPDLPALRHIRGMGVSDSESYAGVLSEKFDYRNTFFDREPRLDLTAIPDGLAGTLDFLVSSEVLEHVAPPVERALKNVWHLLGPSGTLFLTVPYTPEGSTVEHFPQLHDSALARLSSGPVLVNRTPEGKLQVFENLVFHGGHGATLEMRVFSESDIRRMLLDAGFPYVRIYGDDYEPFGIRHTESWSLPIVARKAEAHADLRTCSSLLQTIRCFAGVEAEAAKSRERIACLEREAEDHRAELARRADWARALDADLERARARMAELDAELEKRGKWAAGLESQLREAEEQLSASVRRANALEIEILDRTAWAQDLDRQLSDRTQWAQRLESEAASLRRNLEQIQSTAWYRLGRRLGRVQ